MQPILNRRNTVWIIVILTTAFLTWKTYQQESGFRAVNPVRTITHIESGSRKVMPDYESFKLAGRVKEKMPFFNLFSIPAKKLEKGTTAKIEIPAAPALLLKYMGSVTEENHLRVILDNQGEIFVANVGDNIGVNYKLISINRIANNTELSFLYLPMNITQKMVVPMNITQTMVVRNVSED
jgi:hypothetical protein